MSKIITDENQLNTEVDDLITEDYALEVLGLKNPADFRKFSRSFMKLSKIVKEIDDSNNNKLDKGGYIGTAKNLNDELSKKATKTQLGRIIVGDNLTVDNNGKLNGTPPVDITGKLDKGSVPEKYNTAEKIANELDKKASATELGRVKIGQNLSITADGVLNGNPAYTHPTGNGYSHLPINGATGQFIKYASKGNGQWSQITWNDIAGKPSSFIPNAHTHDDIYYTESEVNKLLEAKANTSGNYQSLTVGSSNYANLINGVYTGSGGKQPPSYIPSGKVRFNMMNTVTNGDSSYKDCLLMDTYSGSDVPIVTAFGISKSTSLRAFIMQGDKNGSDWNRIGELWHTGNFDPSSKANSNHSHTAGQVGAYTKGEIDTKFKNYCPISVGSIDIRYDNKNPAELYSGTTWELLASDKYIRTGATPLTTGGSNSISIAKANLPAVKVQLESFSVTTQPHTHSLHFMACTNQVANVHGNAVHCDNEYQGQVDMRSDWMLNLGEELTQEQQVLILKI